MGSNTVLSVFLNSRLERLGVILLLPLEMEVQRRAAILNLGRMAGIIRNW